ncbi:MAG: NYN domain-containing protein, partial [Pseudomonadota bacterium]
MSTVFIDYDNIYLSLKRKSDEAAKRFAKNAGGWLQAIASGALVTPTNGPDLGLPRRIVMNRCYGNSFPRRNAQDDATDMNSFPFVRHHFVRAGCEVIDCPPLTKQLKNSADIRMVMDVRDYLLHDTYFDEFVILSGDADFTPVLHRLRQHARRTVVYANDYTVAPYRAISDGEIREADLIKLLLEGSPSNQVEAASASSAPKGLPSPASLATARSEILNEVLSTVQRAQQPVPLEALADRAVRVLGHEKTVGLAWGGAGSFRDLLANGLPSEVRLSDAAPYFVYDTTRQSAPAPLRAETRAEPRNLPSPDSVREAQATLERSEDAQAWKQGLSTEPAALTNSRQQSPQANGGEPSYGQQQLAMSEPVAARAEAQPSQPSNGPTGYPVAERTADPMAAPQRSEPRLEAPSVYAPSRTAQPALATPQPQVQPESDVRIEPSLSQPVAQSRQPSHAQAPSPLTSGVAAPSAYANGQPSGMPNANHQPEPQAYAQPQAVVHEQVPNAPSSGTLGRGELGQERRIDADPSQPTQQVFSGAPQHERNTPVSKGPIEPAQASQPSQPRPAQTQPASGPSRESSASALQAAIARIHEACQAPPLSPPEYRVLFQVMAEEITNNGLTGSATLVNIAQRAQDNGVEVRRDDVRFVLEVVSEADPWFEQ